MTIRSCNNVIYKILQETAQRCIPVRSIDPRSFDRVETYKNPIAFLLLLSHFQHLVSLTIETGSCFDVENNWNAPFNCYGLLEANPLTIFYDICMRPPANQIIRSSSWPPPKGSFVAALWRRSCTTTKNRIGGDWNRIHSSEKRIELPLSCCCCWY